jgi:hypothetical protein
MLAPPTGGFNNKKLTKMKIPFVNLAMRKFSVLLSEKTGREFVRQQNA